MRMKVMAWTAVGVGLLYAAYVASHQTHASVDSAVQVNKRIHFAVDDVREQLDAVERDQEIPTLPDASIDD